MTQEDKQLLLKDLCARLPHETWVQYEGKEWLVTGYGHGRVSLLPSVFSSAVGPCPLIEEVRPYLRPISSMTEEEEQYILNTWCEEDYNNGIDIMYDNYMLLSYAPDFIDWLNEHHFNYRLPPHLFIEAPEGMYKTE